MAVTAHPINELENKTWGVDGSQYRSNVIKYYCMRNAFQKKL